MAGWTHALAVSRIDDALRQTGKERKTNLRRRAGAGGAQRCHPHPARHRPAFRLWRRRHQPLRHAGGGGDEGRPEVPLERQQHRGGPAAPAQQPEDRAGKGHLHHGLPRAARLRPGVQLDRPGAERGGCAQEPQLSSAARRRPDLGAPDARVGRARPGAARQKTRPARCQRVDHFFPNLWKKVGLFTKSDDRLRRSAGHLPRR